MLQKEKAKNHFICPVYETLCCILNRLPTSEKNYMFFQRFF